MVRADRIDCARRIEDQRLSFMNRRPSSIVTRPPHGAFPRAVAAGFTLVELVIVVLVIGILVAVAAPRAAQIGKQAKINATLAEARKYQDAAMIFLNKNGRYPNDASHGVYPSDFIGYVPQYNFDTGPALGGVWDWNGPGTSMPHYGIAVRILSTDTATIALFQEIDNQADDGNLATGSIQKVVNGAGEFVQFVLETR